MNSKRKLLDFRNTQWQALCEKYEKRGKINTKDCTFGEVNYKLFAKSKLMKPKRKKDRKANKKPKENKDDSSCNNTESKTEQTLDVDISDIIDDDVYEILPKEHSEAHNSKALSIRNLNENSRTCPIKCKGNGDYEHPSAGDKYISIFQNWPSTEVSKNDNTKHSLSKTHLTNSSKNYTPVKINKRMDNVKYSIDKENCNTKTDGSLADLVHFIESDLRSPLREMTASRSESKILETDDYYYWHDRTKSEMKRLRKYISRDELKEYMRYCSKDVNLNLVRDQISNGEKDNLKELLIKREFARGNEKKYLKYCNRVYNEWRKLVVEIPVEHVILYASCVINSVTEGKQTYFLSYQNQTHKGKTIDLQKESIDSGFVTI